MPVQVFVSYLRLVVRRDKARKCVHGVNHLFLLIGKGRMRCDYGDHDGAHVKWRSKMGDEDRIDWSEQKNRAQFCVVGKRHTVVKSAMAACSPT